MSQGNVKSKSNGAPFRLDELNVEQKIRLCEAQNWRCPDCGKRMDLRAPDEDDRPTFEHVIPLGIGGVDDLENIAILCKPCNKREDTRTKRLPIMQRLKRAFKRSGGIGWTAGLLRLVHLQHKELDALRGRILKDRGEIEELRLKIQEIGTSRKQYRKDLHLMRQEADRWRKLAQSRDPVFIARGQFTKLQGLVRKGIRAVRERLTGAKGGSASVASGRSRR